MIFNERICILSLRNESMRSSLLLEKQLKLSACELQPIGTAMAHGDIPGENGLGMHSNSGSAAIVFSGDPAEACTDTDLSLRLWNIFSVERRIAAANAAMGFTFMILRKPFAIDVVQLVGQKTLLIEQRGCSLAEQVLIKLILERNVMYNS